LANQFSPSHRQARSSQASKGKPESCGVLGNSHIPDINGAETFEGPIFHAGHSSQMFYMQVVTDYIVQAVRA